MAHLYQENNVFLANDDGAGDSGTDDLDEEGPLVPEEDFEELEDEEDSEDKYNE